MTQYKIRITRQAKYHLQGIRDYIIDTFLEPDTAKKIISLLKAKMKSLGDMPERIKTIDEEPWGSIGFRKILVKNYYIYFWINKEKMQVQILAVIYVKRNQIRQLEKMVIEGDEQ